VPPQTRGSNHIRYVGQEQTLRLNTDAPISYIVDETAFVVSRPYNFILGPDETLHGGINDTARDFEQETTAYWRNWSRALATPLEWQDAVIRAAITLKLSVYEDTGAIIAAMTTSVPEAPGSQRNWDYRYCWLRDAFFVVRALNSLSELGTMEDYLRWLTNVVVRSGGGHVQPLYGIGLEEALPEQILDHLPGYQHHQPVRVGNQAYEHFQHDVYGNIVLGAAQAFHDMRLHHRAGAEHFQHLEAVGERAYEVYNQPDAGMWELRTRSRIHTSSALMSWAACDRLAKIAARVDLPERARYWGDRAKEIGDRILTEAWNEQRQAYAESFGGRDLDASVLLMVEVGLIAPTDRASSPPWKRWKSRSATGPTCAATKRRTTSAARDRLQHLHLLAHRCAGAHRPQGAGARDLPGHAGCAQPPGPAVRGYPPGHAPDVGQLPADLFDGGHHQLCDAPVGVMGGGDLMGRLVVVSNRLADPRKPAAGGLAVALGETLKKTGGLWFGWSGKVVENGTPGEGELRVNQAGSVTLAELDLSQEDHDAYYRGYANGVLWPVFHYRLDLAHFEAGHLGGYRRVNQLFARKLFRC
jgi:hypothetical protein